MGKELHEHHLPSSISLKYEDILQRENPATMSWGKGSVVYLLFLGGKYFELETDPYILIGVIGTPLFVPYTGYPEFK